MINTDRIVPIMTVDLLSMYALILKASSHTIEVLDATDSEGDFEITEAPESGSYMASEPLTSMNIDSGVTSVSFYFVPSLAYAGISLNGTLAETSGDAVVADGRSLYLATLSDGTVTIAAQGV